MKELLNKAPYINKNNDSNFKKSLSFFKINGLKVEQNISIFKNETIKDSKDGITMLKDEISLDNILSIAGSEIGIHEETRISDKYFNDFIEDYKENIKGANIDTREDSWAWCAAFVSWVLKNAGYNGAITVRAKNFINETGAGHVAFKNGDKMIGGNQSNQVSEIPIPYDKIVGYAIPGLNELQVYKGNPSDLEKIPDGAILVFDRGRADTQYT